METRVKVSGHVLVFIFVLPRGMWSPQVSVHVLLPCACTLHPPWVLYQNRVFCRKELTLEEVYAWSNVWIEAQVE